LQAVLFPEAFLQRVQSTVADAFDGFNGTAIGLNSKEGAAFDGLAIQKHGTRATAGGIAADVGAGQVEDFTNQVNQQQARFNLHGMFFPVYS
jgi:hypothetical protein